MTTGLRWIEAEPGVRDAVDAWWNQRDERDADPFVLATGAHRAVIRLEGPGGRHLVKLYRSGGGARWLRDRLKRTIGLGAAQREWRGLTRFAEARIPVPRALGLADTADGDAVLVTESVSGGTLRDRLVPPAPGRRALLRRVADLVAALHRAGFVHGDLHPGNIVIGPDGPVLVDLQRASRTRPGSGRQLNDLGLLDYSLRQLDVSRSDRLRVLCCALSVEGLPRRERRAVLLRAIRAAERTGTRQTRIRARRGRPPAAGNHWTR